MKIYTRQGDQGQTQLLSGERVEKDDPRVKTYGALDEFQSHLGFAKTLIRVESISTLLDKIQKDIFIASSELASTPKALTELKYRITQEDVKRLETWIDKFTETYGLPDGFIIPGNSSDSAAVHIARSVCRRCERLIVMLKRQPDFVSNVLIVYFNRLGDLLFVLAWALAIRTIISEVIEELIGRNSGKN
jgi:cob(I)alamin adenosyltransferase